MSETEKAEYTRLKIEKRKTEYLATRLLLKELTGTKQTIIYNKWGKPELYNNKLNLSISHSASVAAIIISESKVGIDVEDIERNVEKVETRFLSDKELNEIKKFTIYLSQMNNFKI